jgi:rhodanese-related sulfurtransferase
MFGHGVQLTESLLYRYTAMYHAAPSVATRAFAVARWLGKERSDAMPKSLKDLVADAKTRIREISATDTAAAAKQDPRLLIVDVREPAEWAEGHIPGALLVPRGMLEAKADLEYANREPRLADRQQAIVLHCASGGRSALAADVLQAMGFTNVRSMAGGIAAWKEKACRSRSDGHCPSCITAAPASTAGARPKSSARGSREI